ncbi:recombinase family protein [Actinomadura scrupuli]|uniref:recombinase family protein n=1 Tax=Actinomadura scrupuli TaxID=559629 RepID=UPI003D972CDD
MSTPPPPVRRPGRPRVCSDHVLALVVDLHLQGLSANRISTVLNDRQISTPEGRPRWARHHVDRLLHTLAARRLLENKADDRSKSPQTKGTI